MKNVQLFCVFQEEEGGRKERETILQTKGI
jgi:hypothetical protein